MDINNYTNNRNKNRGYLKLDVWQRAMELFKLTYNVLYSGVNIDFKLRSQITDSTLSVSSNIAEGYSRRSIHEYLQFLYVSLASLSETLTRAIGLKEAGQISDSHFQQIDTLHYEVENKLLRLIERLEKKRDEGSWINRISEDDMDYTLMEGLHEGCHD
jgi:four helix bundle protein